MGYQKNHPRRQGLTLSNTIVYLMAATLLAGCGGGSSSGTSSAASAVAITQQNSTQVSGASYGAVQSAQDSSTAGAATFASVVVSGGNRSPSLTGFAQHQIIRLEGLDYGASADQAVSAVSTLNFPCDPSSSTTGTITVKLNDADGNGTFSSGDTVSATFQNCYSASDGTTIDGAFSLSGFTLTGDPQVAGTAWNATATFTFTNLSITDATGTDAVDGDFTFAGSTTDGITTTGTLSGSSVSIKQASGPTLTLQNFSITGIDNSNTAVVSVYGSGRVTDSSLNGYIDFQIPSSTPLVASGSLDPSSGTMTITGANKSSIKLTVISSTSVQLQIDANGDGTAESTVTKSWSEISA